jgi:hypothetical protein
MTETLVRKFHGALSTDRGAFMVRIHRFFMSLSLSMTAAVCAVAGCATTDVNHYKPALASQEQCCNRLADPNAKQACLADIPRTQDETSNINQETFQCVEKHFSCDPATGRATRDSAQQQLDCLNDLESTQQARNETPAAAK